MIKENDWLYCINSLNISTLFTIIVCPFIFNEHTPHKKFFKLSGYFDAIIRTQAWRNGIMCDIINLSHAG